MITDPHSCTVRIDECTQTTRAFPARALQPPLRFWKVFYPDGSSLNYFSREAAEEAAEQIRNPPPPVTPTPPPVRTCATCGASNPWWSTTLQAWTCQRCYAAIPLHVLDQLNMGVTPDQLMSRARWNTNKEQKATPPLYDFLPKELTQ